MSDRYGCPECGHTRATRNVQMCVSEYGCFDRWGSFLEEDSEIYDSEPMSEYTCADCSHEFDSPAQCCEDCELPMDGCECNPCPECNENEGNCYCRGCTECGEIPLECFCEEGWSAPPPRRPIHRVKKNGPIAGRRSVNPMAEFTRRVSTA